MILKLSPSRINLFMECKRCFWLRVNEGVERPSGPFPSLPGGMDSKIKDHFDRFRQSGDLPPELRDEIDAHPVQDEEFLSRCRKWQTDPHYRDEDLDVMVRGGVDDLLRAPDDSIIVLDYKTRGYPPKGENGAPEYYERQVNLYNLILRSNGYSTKDYGLLLYYYPDEVLENGDFLFNNELRKVPVDIDAAKELVHDAVDTLQGSIPDHNHDCDYCDWNAAQHST